MRAIRSARYINLEGHILMAKRAAEEGNKAGGHYTSEHEGGRE